MSIIITKFKLEILFRIIVCPLLYAPKYCDNRLPPQDNKLKDVIEVNQWIHKFNKDNTGNIDVLTHILTCHEI